MHEYWNLVHSKRWEPATVKNISQYQYSLLKAYNVAIKQLVNKSLKQIYLKSRWGVNGSNSQRGLSVNSNVTCDKYGKKGEIHKD